jgi:hypothetical protein
VRARFAPVARRISSERVAGHTSDQEHGLACLPPLTPALSRGKREPVTRNKKLPYQSAGQPPIFASFSSAGAR